MSKLIENKMTFASLTRRVPCIESECGSELYKWSYLNDKGEIIEDETNTQQMIMSFARQVDYKKQIEKGELVQNATGEYMDISQFGTDYNDVSKYLADLVMRVKTELNKGPDKGSEGDTSQSKALTKEVGTDKGPDTPGAAGGNA